jgi:hypothetical protein
MRAKRASIDRSTSSAFVSQRGRERRTFIQRSSCQLASTVTNARISRSGGARNRPSTPRAITVGSAQAASTRIPPSRRERRTRMAAAMTAIPDTSPSMSGSTVGVTDCKAGMRIASAPSVVMTPTIQHRMDATRSGNGAPSGGEEVLTGVVTYGLSLSRSLEALANFLFTCREYHRPPRKRHKNRCVICYSTPSRSAGLRTPKRPRLRTCV